MVQWRGEFERERKAHKATTQDRDSLRDLVTHVRAFLRRESLERDFLEFVLAARIGEKEAAELVKKCYDETEANRAKHAPSQS